MGLFEGPRGLVAGEIERIVREDGRALLSEEQREVVLMKVWGGLSLSEIGEVAGIPRDTAASRYRYAIKRLRECMKEFIDE